MDYTCADDNLTLHTDMYQINMMQTYWELGRADLHAVFECYFREIPFNHSYVISVGLGRLVNYLENLTFIESDIAYLREVEEYSEDFLTYSVDFEFKCTVRPVLEGDLVFNNEPLIQIEGPLAQCQLVETALPNMMNFQTLIATRTARIKPVTGDDPLLEFGTCRAQELDAVIWGTRTVYIGGVNAISNVRAGKIFGIPVSGTYTHLLVQSHRNNYEAFVARAKTYRDRVFLVDTYDILKVGMPSAIRVAREVGSKINFLDARIDSGDMAYTSKRVHEQLDEAGFTEAKIYASNDLDENTISSLKMQKSKTDVWGVGTKSTIAYDQPASGAVFKLASTEGEDGQMKDTIKLSSDTRRVITPGKKQVWRTTRKSDKRSEGGYVTLRNEGPHQEEEIHMFHPVHTPINKHVRDFEARSVPQDIFVEGKCVYELPTLDEIKQYVKENLDSLWEEYKRDLNPQKYSVDLSTDCWNHKMNLLEKVRKDVKRLTETVNEEVQK